MRDFLKKYKKVIIEVLAIIGIVAAVSLVSALLLLAFNIIYFDDGMKFNVELFSSFKSSWYGWIIFVLLQTVLSMLLCVIPGASMAFILLIQAIYSIPWQAFLISLTSVVISSAAMYILGRYGGYKICVKLLGEADCEKSLGLLRDKGTVFFPLMMMFPIFPDDALVMIAGTLKMSLKWFIPSIIVGRGVGIATIVFGLAIIPFDKFVTPWHWIGFVILCILFLAAVFYTAGRLNKYLEKRKRILEAYRYELSPLDDSEENDGDCESSNADCDVECK